MVTFAHAFLAATTTPTTHDLLVDKLVDLSTPLHQTVPNLQQPDTPHIESADPRAERIGALDEMVKDRISGFDGMSTEERIEALVDAARYQAAREILEGDEQQRKAAERSREEGLEYEP